MVALAREFPAGGTVKEILARSVAAGRHDFAGWLLAAARANGYFGTARPHRPLFPGTDARTMQRILRARKVTWK
jgi:hypothetical protein